ncbi:hypothetical protein RHGRI_010110 [Rhododendron griersonianum]|uniref:NAC domain-containing protein n=1 Tax=Rhododendron griersonianum TaxID=479676 RepID=A0AAV6KH80_9ERIC|nr:hypothetical protein RHGRI_010110 [Rhododendron griersonianum]
MAQNQHPTVSRPNSSKPHLLQYLVTTGEVRKPRLPPSLSLNVGFVIVTVVGSGERLDSGGVCFSNPWGRIWRALVGRIPASCDMSDFGELRLVRFRFRWAGVGIFRRGCWDFQIPATCVVCHTHAHTEYMGSNNVNLPPGFRFYSTDEELVVHFLHRKAALLPFHPDVIPDLDLYPYDPWVPVALLPFHPDVIPDLDLYPYDPWELDGKALAEWNKWYYFSRRTQNRISGSGFWKPLGVDEPVFSTSSTTGSKKLVGLKKHFYVFYKTTEATAEVKTNWIMQEFRLSEYCGSTSTSGRSSKRRGNQKVDYSTWVLCRIYERNCDDGDDSAELSCLDEVFLSLDDLDEISLPNN